MELPTWVPASEAKPAPAPLLLVQSFVNTRDNDLGTDLLAEPGPAGQWLRAAGLLGPRAAAGPDELRTAREAREAIRTLIEAGGAAPGDSEIATLEAVARTGQPRLSVGQDGQVHLAGPPNGSLADGLASLLLIIRDAQRDGTWARLRICGNPDCRWAFYDRSHSRRGIWCDMASCGNIIKNRNLRARRSARAEAAALSQRRS
jgi:predicted RNA-binding Zn ribbon-like protein